MPFIFKTLIRVVNKVQRNDLTLYLWNTPLGNEHSDLKQSVNNLQKFANSFKQVTLYIDSK